MSSASGAGSRKAAPPSGIATIGHGPTLLASPTTDPRTETPSSVRAESGEDVARGDGFVAVCADEPRVSRLTAWLVDQLERALPVLGREMAVGPSHEADDHGIQLECAVGEPVLVPVWVGAIADAFEQTVGDEMPEPIGENVAGDSEVALHLAVAAHAEERLAEDQEGPAVAEDVDCDLDGVSRGTGTWLVNPGQLVFSQTWIGIKTGFYMKPYPATHSLRPGGRTMNKQIELSAGTIEYRDTGGAGQALVLLHGLLMDASLWDEVIDDLAPEYRCVAPTLPLGAHRHAMSADADLSPRGLARLASELIDRLDLNDVTLVGNDTGGVLVQLLAGARSPRIGQIVLVSCDAFDNFPPGLTGDTLVLAGRLPPSLFGLFMQPLRLRPFRRLPLAFGWLTMRGDAMTRRWLSPVLTQRAVRRDTVRVLRGIAAKPGLLLDVAEELRGFDRPALVAWASADRVMPPDHGRRLAELLPHGHLIEFEDSYTLIPLDQPVGLASALRDFHASLAARRVA
jgi:pimeloyl-ACP methyl ester carboxylesterase